MQLAHEGEDVPRETVPAKAGQGAPARTVSPGGKHSKVLEAAFEDAAVFADYAARYDVPNAFEAIDAIAVARDAFSRGDLTAADLRVFYAPTNEAGN